MPRQKWLCSICGAGYDAREEAFVCEEHDRIHPCRHCLKGEGLVPVVHPENAVVTNTRFSQESYQVMKCQYCGEYWLCDQQHDEGSGSSNNCEPYGKDPSNIK